MTRRKQEAAAISEVMTLLNVRRWAKATQAQKDKQGLIMRAGKKSKKAKKRGKR